MKNIKFDKEGFSKMINQALISIKNARFHAEKMKIKNIHLKLVNKNIYLN